MTKPLDAFIFEKEGRDLMLTMWAEEGASTVETPRAEAHAAKVNGFVEFGKGQNARARSPFGVLARCEVCVFEDGTPEYAYLTDTPSAEPLEKRGNGYENRQRFAWLERVVNRDTGVLAVRVWMLGSQLARMNAEANRNEHNH